MSLKFSEENVEVNTIDGVQFIDIEGVNIVCGYMKTGTLNNGYIYAPQNEVCLFLFLEYLKDKKIKSYMLKKFQKNIIVP